MAAARDVVVVGAGLAGVTAARALHASGHRVVVLDKGRSPGGRMATRRIGRAHLDHGAQFMTVRSSAFAEQMASWEADGLVHVWGYGFDGTPDGHPRYAATRGMASLVKNLAAGLDVRCQRMVFTIRAGGARRWRVIVDDATTHDADAVIVTCPLPQSSALLVEADIDAPEELLRTDYHRTLALLGVIDAPPAVRAPGGMHAPDDTFLFVADNQAKGISPVPAVTLHANAAWSEAHWDGNHDDTLDRLEAAAGPWLGRARVVERHLKRWRFATPRTIWPEPCWSDRSASIVLAGDAFAGPRVEGAYLSGLAAAARLDGR
jgi:predicted NAD/FAD-dependent oxidoreductase